MRNTKKKYKYKSYSNKSANINHQYFRNKINEAKKLYIPNYNNISKSKMDMYKINEDKNKLVSSKKYLKFKQILNNYMNDYEKLKKQNKIPEYEEKNYYSYQEFEIEKNNVRELFDSIIDLNGHDEFNDTDKIIQNLPDDFDNMFLKNDATKKDYALRYEIINGEKLEETERVRSKTENNINHDANKLNQNCLLENNEEEDDNDENNNNNINNMKNNNINKQNNEIKNDNIIEEENINNNIRINKDEEININNNINNNNNINQKIEELNNNNIIENNNKIEEEEKNNNENNIEETSKEQNNNNIDEQNTSKNNELNSENKIDEEKNIDNKNETEEKKENEEENNINNEEKKELENEMGQNKFRKFRESEEKEISEDKDKKEESLEKYDDFE